MGPQTGHTSQAILAVPYWFLYQYSNVRLSQQSCGAWEDIAPRDNKKDISSLTYNVFFHALELHSIKQSSVIYTTFNVQKLRRTLIGQYDIDIGVANYR
jgi:hypothetical protein